MTRYVAEFSEIDRTQVALVGGKGANLGELSRVEGIHVPAGFCVTTEAYQRARGGPSIPEEVAAEIADGVVRLGAECAYAVRSSATAEDSSTASFAGQHDTFLNVVGTAEILRHVSLCWASLFTERAIRYRSRNGIDEQGIQMAVVVQRMVVPEASGILFTADPVTGNRKTAKVEGCFGLGEDLVSGVVDSNTKALTELQVVRLTELGRRIEAHFGCPQDIEWCLVNGAFQFVQTRPITTLFPIPAGPDEQNRVYISVGHQQMMTDAMKPLGISFRQLTARIPMYEAGGRLFVDVTPHLASVAGRAGLMDMLGKSDPLIGDALETILNRDFLPHMTEGGGSGVLPASAPGDTDPAMVDDLIAASEASVAALERDIQGKSGVELIDFILADIQEMQRILFDPQNHEAIMTGMEATWWLNEHLLEWLGEKNAADALTQSVPNNITSEMGLALLDVADVIRPYPEVVSLLERAEGLHELPSLVREAIEGWLNKYGMRCVGEIDITRTRWREEPMGLVPLILGNVRNFGQGEAKRRFDEGLKKAREKEVDILRRLRALPDGERKAAEVKSRIDRVRAFAGYREYPKYGMVSRYFVYKRALMEEAERLVEAHVIRDLEDIFYLTLQELREVVSARRVDHQLLHQRQDAYRKYQRLNPPRVLTSDGECLNGSYRRGDLPDGALAGLAVSAGVAEGTARVIADISDANLEPGDILVTSYTDPSWTPLFVAVKGLVTEVGGLMTHGAVIAREYGLPAVVGVEHATRVIRNGQRIRVHGTEGYVEILGS